MSDELPDMSDDARAVLRGEKSALPAAPGRDRVRARLDATLFGPPGGGGGGGGGGGAEPANGMESAGSDARSAAIRAKWMSQALICIGGVVMGVALTVALRKPDVVQSPPTVVSVYVDRGPPPNATQVTPTVLASTGSVESAQPAASVQAAASVGVQQRPDSISEERALLDPARTALGRGDGPSALAGVKKHEQKFPKGQLAEEREAIAVQALVALGRGDLARARGERFKRTYPNSVLAPAVNAAMEALPK